MRSSMASPPRHHDVETLWKAAKKHEFARVKQLLVGASTATGSRDLANAYSARRGTTALMAACMKRETEHKHPERSAAQTVQLLLEFGADWALRARDRDGDTALHFAAACNQVRSVEFLVRAGVDVFALNARGHTALDVARWHGSADVVDVLTSLLRIHSGWLFVRTTKMRRDRGKGLRVWKKRWAVALACDPHRRVVELALLRDRDSTRPHRVVLLDAETDSLVPLPKAKWLDRHNMFHADSNVVVQKPRARRFSRTNPQPSTGYREVELLEFAAESASQREAWMSIVRRSAYGMPLAGRLPTAATATPPPDRMQWQPERPLPIVVSEPMVDGRQDLFGSESSATTSRASVLSPLGESHAAPTYMTLSPAHVSAAQGVAVSPRRRDEPSAPSFISMTDSLRMSELAIHEQSATAASKDHDASSSSSSSEPDARSKECVICMDAPRDAICVPCGHVAGCYACLVRQVEAYSGCPICRAPAQTVVKIYQC